MNNFKLYKKEKGQLFPYTVYFHIDEVKRLEYKINGSLTRVVFNDRRYYFMGTPEEFLSAYNEFSKADSVMRVMDLNNMVCFN